MKWLGIIFTALMLSCVLHAHAEIDGTISSSIEDIGGRCYAIHEEWLLIGDDALDDPPPLYSVHQLLSNKLNFLGCYEEDNTVFYLYMGDKDFLLVATSGNQEWEAMYVSSSDSNAFFRTVNEYSNVCSATNETWYHRANEIPFYYHAKYYAVDQVTRYYYYFIDGSVVVVSSYHETGLVLAEKRTDVMIVKAFHAILSEP